MKRTLLAWLPCLPMFAQDPAADVAAALLREDHAAAARAIASVTSPAARARLQAAMLPEEHRAAALLAAARAFLDDPEADRALLAGAAAALLGLDRKEALPGLAAWMEVEDGRSWADAEDLAPVVLGLREAVGKRRASGGDQALLQEAQRLLELACVSRFGLWPARVQPGAAWERPAGLAETLHLRALPCAPGHVRWDQLDQLPAPAWTGTLPPSGAFALPVLPAGNWVLEARSPGSPWRGVRVVEVSELDAIALAADRTLVLAAFDRAGSAAARWQLRAGDAELARGELGAKPVLVALPEAKAGNYATRELRLQGASGTAWLEVGEHSVIDRDGARWLVHTMVDRPLYRPGETVQGRVVLRTCTWQGDGLAAVPSTQVAAGRDVKVIIDLGTAGKVTLPGRTDERGVLPFSFVVPAEVDPGTWFDFAVELPETNTKGEPLRIGRDRLCGTSFFRRQAVQLAVDGPAQVAAEAEIAEVAITASWASGGPAAGLDVRATVTAWRSRAREETLALRTDEAGRAVVRIPVAKLETKWVRVQFVVTGPDGRSSQESHQLRVVRKDEPQEQEEERDRWSWRSRGVSELELGPAVVGRSCRVALRGKPREQVLLVVGRSRNARAETVQLDAEGRATLDVPVLRLDWPRLDVAAATRAGCSHESVPVRLRERKEPRIELPERASPGSDVTCRIGTDAPGSVVTIAVVDERIFEIEVDRTRDPEAALRPEVPYGPWSHEATPAPQHLADLLGSLLRDGRLPLIDGTRDLSRWGPPSGGAAAPSYPAPNSLRSRFCPTALFTTVVADADGTASVSFRLPDDLTRWRVTVAGIDPEGSGFLVQRSFASRMPLAAEPVLPRGVREGDAFQLPVAIDRSADAGAPSNAAVLAAASGGDALQVERATTEVAVPAGRVVSATVPLRARAAGEAQLSLQVALGDHLDRSVRALPIGRDAVVRPLRAAALGAGTVQVALPEGTSPDHGLRIDVLQGGAAAWAQLEADLAAYPYGCVEQTLSRLVPYFAMARAAKERGEPWPEMDAGFRKRLHAGLARLRELQHGSGQFGFWPGDEPDPAFTGLVLHGLAMLRDGGFDLERTGLSLEPYRLREPLPRGPGGATVVDKTFLGLAELAVGALRLHPGEAWLRAEVQRVFDVLPQLPAGLAARLGLALHAAGDLGGARACHERLAAVAPPALPPDGFPGEDPLAIAALRLELACALEQPAAERERAAADLLLACLHGRGSTYAHACALAALARVLPRSAPVAATIEIEAGTERRTFQLGGERSAEHRDAVHWRLSRAAAVTVRGPDRLPLLVRISTELAESASDHAAWATPIRVEREFCTSRPDADWHDRREGKDLVPSAGPILVGRQLWLRVRVQSPVPARYVVVDCPLPAGFEFAEESEGVERFDDRFVFRCDLPANEPVVRAFRVVPTVAGRLVWPPVVAAPMYVTGCEGGTAGGFVDVAAVAPGDVPAVATCFLGPAPVEVEPPPDPLADWCDAFRGAFTVEREPDRGIVMHLFAGTGEYWEKPPAWGETGPDEATRAALVAALWTKLPPHGEAEAWHWLELLDNLLDLDVPGSAALRPEMFWRFGALARLQGLHREATLVVLPLPLLPAEVDRERQCMAIGKAVAHWPHGAEREQLLARLIGRAREAAPCVVRDLLSYVQPPARTAALRAELRECVVRADTRQEAFAAMSLAGRAALPPAVVLGDLRGECDEGVVRMLGEREDGRAELRARLRVPDFVVVQRAALVAELPAELWREVTLPAYGALVVAAADDDEDGPTGPAAIAARLAAAPFAEAALQQEMAATQVPAWRAALATGLRQRGVTAVAATPRAGDDLWPLWTKALALGTADVGAALALLDEIQRRRAPGGLDVELDLLVAFVLPSVLASCTPQQAYAARSAMSDTTWRAVWERFGTAERVVLLDLFQKHVSETFAPATAAEAEAIWRFLLRSGDVEGAVDALIATAVGAAFLRARLLAGEGGERRDAIRKHFADRLDLDPDTLAPDPDSAWHALARRVRRWGFAGEWTAAEQERLRQVRLLRGVGEVGGG